MSIWLITGIVLVVILFALYLSMTAGRLDRLHQRIDTSTIALDALLLRRSSVALELASSGAMDPASSIVVAEAAHAARLAEDADLVTRFAAESDLTESLLAALEEPEELAMIRGNPLGAPLLEELDASCRRVELGRHFLDDAVRACRAVRTQRLVLIFRLAGHTPWPASWEILDTPPPGLASR